MAERFPKFRLPHQNNLQQFFTFGFEIRQKPKLLQCFHAQVLSLIDNKDRSHSLPRHIEQKTIKRLTIAFPITDLALNPKALDNGPQKLDIRKAGIND